MIEFFSSCNCKEQETTIAIICGSSSADGLCWTYDYHYTKASCSICWSRYSGFRYNAYHRELEMNIGKEQSFIINFLKWLDLISFHCYLQNNFCCQRMDIQTIHGAFGSLLHKLNQYSRWFKWSWSWTDNCHLICCKHNDLEKRCNIILL